MERPVYNIVANNLSLIFPLTFTLQHNEIVSISNREPQRAGLSHEPQDLNNIYYTLRGPRTVCPIRCIPAIDISACGTVIFFLIPASQVIEIYFCFTYQHHFFGREGMTMIADTLLFSPAVRDAVACEKMVSPFADIGDIYGQLIL